MRWIDDDDDDKEKAKRTSLTCFSLRSRKARWAALFCSLRFRARFSSWITISQRQLEGTLM